MSPERTTGTQVDPRGSRLPKRIGLLMLSHVPINEANSRRAEEGFPAADEQAVVVAGTVSGCNSLCRTHPLANSTEAVAARRISFRGARRRRLVLSCTAFELRIIGAPVHKTNVKTRRLFHLRKRCHSSHYLTCKRESTLFCFASGELQSRGFGRSTGILPVCHGQEAVLRETLQFSCVQPPSSGHFFKNRSKGTCKRLCHAHH